jgi:hypothetical protein
MSNENTKYWLKSFFNEEIQKTGKYKSLKSQIDRNGSFDILNGNNRFKIYTPELALILISNDLTVEEISRNKKSTHKTINGCEFQDTYFEEYNKGISYFDKYFSISSNTLYGENGETYVRDLHNNYFHNKNRDCFGMGWSYFKKYSPITLTNKIIRKFGFYSGIVNKVDELIDKYPKLFQNFEYCEHELIDDLSPQPIIIEHSRTKQNITQMFETMDNEGWEYAFRSENDYNTFTDLLTNFFEYKEYHLPKTLIQLKKRCKTKLGRILGEIHKELSENALKSDKKYFEILKCLNHYQNETDLYKVLTIAYRLEWNS